MNKSPSTQKGIVVFIHYDYAKQYCNILMVAKLAPEVCRLCDDLF